MHTMISSENLKTLLLNAFANHTTFPLPKSTCKRHATFELLTSMTFSIYNRPHFTTYPYSSFVLLLFPVSSFIFRPSQVFLSRRTRFYNYGYYIFQPLSFSSASSIIYSFTYPFLKIFHLKCTTG